MDLQGALKKNRILWVFFYLFIDIPKKQPKIKISVKYYAKQPGSIFVYDGLARLCLHPLR
jgi:hypothetical protein